MSKAVLARILKGIFFRIGEYALGITQISFTCFIIQMMASTTFLLQLQNYPKDTINDEMIDLLQPYFRMEDYNMDMARRVCGDVAGLLSWTKAMSFFHSVNKEVLPLKANLTLQEARLKVKNPLG